MIPQTLTQLLERAQAIAGLSFGELADDLGILAPPDLKRDKGWVGMLLETALGASAGSKAEQDFAHLGVELKTLPINEQGFPLETTFVSLAPLVQNSGVQWENSHVRHKLSCVLWIPVEGCRHIALRDRHIGSPILWQPSPEQERQLKQDWEELMEYITLGRLNEITARIGEVMQLRPKGANSKAITKGIGKNGEVVETLPLGFYLRKEFTAGILRDFLGN
ncbi:DNA mismatch repair endonuclease MutH [Rodentibacter pneumotropicus]|uniref:DNA mismatch repair protein MutH n=1 Tax=Rodentibacter pneumotropicus TaxID=758 RepID=A0A3S4TUB2_9PAST|nr:DNA mismatch repair endonuclease MutH [Rodentibacter pneumotropicus]NBH74482.1 DNA mismatch repair endonuclease MutH [Rodentibacter pneumotropicus]OOF62562.1 DNA mismatch repair endonuclease MutH [Rodentibacter pneumotropicus]THA04418.1 DNA mismatch repair endonuclease MutH [Rodentibacter pneumotropicus]THA05464.1 DNA mismatch repair endonuclease MutH [Rodentibacter pneumotropicus]THA11891.1 DNA mismatch repair endonuclease MutH [Rodentibacter pneumotropicus]